MYTFENFKNLIPEEAAAGAARNSSMRPDNLAKSYREDFAKKMVTLQEAYIKVSPEGWKETFDKDLALLKKKYIEVLSAESRTANWFVTGAANFPVQQQKKRRATSRKRWEAYWSAYEYYLNRFKRKINKINKANSNPLEDAKKALQIMERNHEEMKLVNKLIRENKGEHINTISKKIAEALGRKPMELNWILQDDNLKKSGYPPYKLQNSNASMKRIKDRITQLEKKKALQEELKEGKRTAHKCDDYELLENYDADRIQFIFVDKPNEEARNILKKRFAFKWSNRYGAWQRQLTPNGQRAAQQAILKLKELENLF